MNQKFQTNGAKQCYIDTTINSHGVKRRDSLYVNVDPNAEPHVTITIDANDEGNGPETSAHFQFYGDNLQSVVDWLKNSKIIR